MPITGFLTAKAARPDLYRAGSLVIRGLQASLIPWSFRPPLVASGGNSHSSLSSAVHQEGIYLVSRAACTGNYKEVRDPSVNTGSLLSSLPDEQTEGGGVSTDTEDESKQGTDPNDSDDSKREEDGSYEESDAEDDGEELGAGADGVSRVKLARAAVHVSGGVFGLLSVQDGQEDSDEE